MINDGSRQTILEPTTAILTRNQHIVSLWEHLLRHCDFKIFTLTISIITRVVDCVTDPVMLRHDGSIGGTIWMVR